MSIDRQFGVHEIPGTEEPAPSPAKTTVSAGFELQMRGYVNQLWAKLVELEERVEALSERPVSVSAALGVEEVARQPPPHPKPWEAEGVSRRTWHRRHKGAA